jgi:hypothetical protein
MRSGTRRGEVRRRGPSKGRKLSVLISPGRSMQVLLFGQGHYFSALLADGYRWAPSFGPITRLCALNVGGLSPNVSPLPRPL